MPDEASEAAEGAMVAALMGLPGAGSVRLGRLLTDREPGAAWAAVRAGRIAAEVAPAAVRDQWRRAAATVDLAELASRLDRLGAAATSWGHVAHPTAFTADIDPAPTAIRRGRPPDEARPHVAVVGTRRASAIGREVARELGHDQAEAGVVVVSGLARGVDGAAHAGALAAAATPPLAVVGSGPDVVYPASNAEAWATICRVGTLLTEAPLGARPDAWRFPARNRLIAALADLVVVVESRGAGGSLLTVDQAIRRGVDVMAVPGSLRNPAAEGTNALLADGCAPVRDATDVLVALGLDPVARRAPGGPAATGPLDPAATAALEAMGDGPASVDELHDRTALPVATLLAALDLLVADGLAEPDGARWCRR